MTIKLNYTTIHHEARKKLDISMNEYALADLIYHLQNNPANVYPDWCYATKAALGATLGLSERTVLTLLNKLANKRLVIKDPRTKYLQTTKAWYSEAVLTEGEESSSRVKNLHVEGEESSSWTGEESSSPYNNNNIDNNTYKDTAPLISPIVNTVQNSEKGPAPYSKNLQDSAKPIVKTEAKATDSGNRLYDYLESFSANDLEWLQGELPGITKEFVEAQVDRAIEWAKKNWIQSRATRSPKSMMKNWLERALADKPRAKRGAAFET